VFCFFTEFLTVDVRFLLTIKVMELLFPLVDMVVIVFSLILLNYDGLYLCFFFLFLLYFCRNAQIYVFQLEGVAVIISFNGGCLAIFFFKFSS